MIVRLVAMLRLSCLPVILAARPDKKVLESGAACPPLRRFVIASTGSSGLYFYISLCSQERIKPRVLTLFNLIFSIGYYHYVHHYPSRS